MNVDEFVKQVKQHLINNRCKEVLNFIYDCGTEEILDKTSWELVPIIVEYLTQDNINNNIELFQSCEDILNIIANKCNPAETVLLFLEQVENLENDVRFRSLLKPLSLCLNNSDISRYIEWIVSTIRAYTEALPLPENEKSQLNGKNSDAIVERLTTTYQSIIIFLKSLINYEVINNYGSITKVKLYLLHLHLNLFGKPFSNLNFIDTLEDETNIFHLSIMQMLQINGNLLGSLDIIEDRSHKYVRKLNTNDMNIDNLNQLKIKLFHIEIPDLAYANYYFTLMSSKSLQHHIPHVYNPHYIMHSCLYLGNYLLTQSEYIFVSKGLHLINNILQRIEKETIKHETLQLSAYTNLLLNLSQVMIYCDSLNERKMALYVLQNYIECFNMHARYLIIVHLYEKNHHSGFLALVINILKESIIKSLNETPPCEYFIGKNLESLLKRIYKLPNGSTSDLIEISDEIIAALNLLRYLVIRDKKNITGLWSYIDNIQNNYLNLLRKGIDLTRAHWKVKINDLVNQKKRNKENINNDIIDDDDDITSVVVGGENLPKMPIEEKIKFCYHALNALDIIESIAVRVNECIEMNPMNNIT